MIYRNKKRKKDDECNGDNGSMNISKRASAMGGIYKMRLDIIYFVHFSFFCCYTVYECKYAHV